MDEAINNNYAEISGTLLQLPQLSHENRGERFYRAVVAVQRLSGTDDILNIIIREKPDTESSRMGKVEIDNQR